MRLWPGCPARLPASTAFAPTARAAVTQATAQHMMVRGLIERDSGAGSFVPTDHGRAALTIAAASGLDLWYNEAALKISGTAATA